MGDLRDRQLSFEARVNRKMKGSDMDRADAALEVIRELTEMRKKGFEPYVPEEPKEERESIVDHVESLRHELTADYAVAARKRKISATLWALVIILIAAIGAAFLMEWLP
jgi:hypothetical protein